MVRFENANVIMIGDFYRNFGYPFIDRANGGTLNGMLEGCDQLMKVAGPDTTLIPGHGTWIKRTDLVPYAEMIKSVRDKVQQLIAQGKTEKEVVAAKVDSTLGCENCGRTWSRGRRHDERRSIRQRGVSGTEEYSEVGPQKTRGRGKSAPDFPRPACLVHRRLPEL